MLGGHILSFGPYRLDTEKVRLWCDTQVVRLTPKAFQVLCYVVERPGQLVTKEELFRVVWADTVVGDAALTMCVQEIRKALQDNAKSPQYLETVHRQGFRFIAEVGRSQEEEENQKVKGKNQKAKVEEQEIEIGTQTEKTATKRETEADKTELNDGGLRTLDVQTPTPSTQHPAPNTQSSVFSSQHLDSPLPSLQPPASTRFWSSKGLMVTGLLLLVGTIIAVQYHFFLLPIPQPLAPTSQSALPLPDKPSIIVLPFVNLSGDPTQEYFNDGITEEITARLARVSSLFVIARTSAFTYKGKGAKVQDISRELGVRYVVEGSVRKTEEQVRVIAQLIDATTGAHLWAEHYNRPLKGIFAVQDEIVQAVVTALKVKLTPEEQKIFSYAPTESLEAYDYMLRGWQYHMSLTLGANVQARRMFEKAIELDPRYAIAYASLAATYMTEWLFQQNQDPQIRERAFALAHKALALDDSAPGVHEVLGILHLWLNKQHEQAIAEGKRSIALGPNCASCYGSLGETLVQAGRPADATAFLEKAMRLDPLSGMRAICLTSLGKAYRMMGKYEEALSPLRKALTFNPDFWNAHLQLAVTYSELGREQEARAEVADLVRTNPQMSLEILRRMSVHKDPAFLERTIAALRKAGLK